MRGHPTLANSLAALGIGAGFAVNQALANRTAWFINPINGSNSNDGQTLATAIQTRSEFYRRMAGVTLRQNVAVTITSSLLAGDTFLSTIWIPFPFILTFLGVPTPLITPTAITGYIANNGATNIFSQITLVGVNFAPLVNKVVEFNNGAGTIISAIIVADLGASTARVSPQINTNPLAPTAPANFVNGQVVNIWDMPNLGASVNVTDGTVAHRYFQATQFVNKAGRSDWFNCLGGFTMFGGSNSIVNCYSTAIVAVGGSLNEVRGGFINIQATDCTLRMPNDLVVSGITSSAAIVCTVIGSYPGFTPSIELLVQGGDPFAFRILYGSMLLVQGNVYGNNGSSQAFSVEGPMNLVEFRKGINFTGNKVVNWIDLGLADTLASLASVSEIFDSLGNRIVGPFGPLANRILAMTNAQGLIAETGQRINPTGPQAVASGTLYFTQIFLVAGEVITTSTVATGIVATVQTFARVGLWDCVTGALLASCVDQGAAWATLGLHSQAFSVPFTVPVSGVYYIGALTLAGVGPGLNVIATLSANKIGLLPGLGGRPILYGSVAGLVDLPNPLVIAAGAVPGALWIGVS